MDIGSFFNSSFFVWLMIGMGILHLYLRKTGKTLVELVKEIKEALESFNQEQ